MCHALEADQLSREYGLAMQLLHSLARSSQEAKCTTVTMCRRLTPLLSAEWVWWLHERPLLLRAVSDKLLDCQLCELVGLMVPTALPHVVVLGGLSMQYSARPEVFSGKERERGSAAVAVLHALAECLGVGCKELLVENMHGILAEVFSRQTADDSLDDNDVNLINASLEFMYSNGG